jgi:hypothetical protein
MSNAAISGTSNEEEVISPPLHTSEPSSSTFFFVNETGEAASYKQGHRPDIRSHVRKLSMKQFRKTHKSPPKRNTKLPKYVPLTSQSLDFETSEDLEHDEDYPSKFSPTTQLGISTRDLIPVKLNPIGTLGAGRLDPFSSLPMDEPNLYSQELMDHGGYNFSLKQIILLPS